MKKTLQRMFHHRHACCAVSLALGLFTLTAHAQLKWTNTAGYPVNVGLSSEILISNTGAYTEAINCDAYTEFNTAVPGVPLTAVVWDDAYLIAFPPTAYALMSHIAFVAPTTGAIVIHDFPFNAQHPDIVLGDDLSGRPGDVIAMTVYEWSGAIWLKRYQVRQWTGGGIFAAEIDSTQIAASGSWPHIDMYHDRPSMSTIYGLGDKPFDKFVITWTENAGGGTYEVHAANGDISSLSISNNTIVATSSSSSMVSDVACQTDVSNTQDLAHIVVYDGTDVFEKTWVIGGSFFAKKGLESGITLSANGKPRIEAMNNYDASNGNIVDWDAVWGTTASPLRIHGRQSYGNAVVGTSYTDYSTQVGLANTSNIPVNNGYSPVVAAGCGRNADRFINYGSLGSQPCNDYYLPGWRIEDVCGSACFGVSAPNSYDFQFFREDGFTAATIIPNFGYSTINTSSIGSSPYCQPTLAMGCSSNSGYDMMAAWNDGANNVVMKYAGNFPVFKPTGIANTAGVKRSISPNPATNQLALNGIENAHYAITDMAGRSLKRGTASHNENTIDISSLAKGMYMCTITENGKSQNFKFVKE